MDACRERVVASRLERCRQSNNSIIGRWLTVVWVRWGAGKERKRERVRKGRSQITRAQLHDGYSGF